MNWTKASAIAEILSSVAILATLVYLAIEIRQNTATLEATSQQAQLDTNYQTLFAAINDPALWLSRVKANLTEEESVKLSAYLIAVTIRGQVAWQQYQAGALDANGWIAAREAVLGNLQYTQSRKWWDYMADGFLDPAFQNEISAGLSERPVVTELPDVLAFQ